MRKVLGAPRGPEVRNYTLKPLKETCIFADCITGWQSESSRTFHGWPELPTELKLAVMRFVYTFKERIEIVYTSETVKDVSPAEDLTNRRFQFVPVIKTPLALIPKSGGAYHRLSLGETAAVISNPRRVGKDCRTLFIEVFYQSITFEIEDNEYSLRSGTHRWLECMEQNGFLAHISKVNIFVDTVLCPQKVWHFRRVAY